MPDLSSLNPLAHLRRTRPAERRHRLAVGTATTADGARAEVHVDYVVSIAAGVVADDADAAASDAVEGLIREAIAEVRVADLPLVGDVLHWGDRLELPDVSLEHVVVADSEVQVTAELRRLLGGEGDGPDPWT